MRAQVRGTAVGFLLTTEVLEQAILYARRELISDARCDC